MAARPPPLPPQNVGPVLGGFLLDLCIAVGALLALSLVGMLAWALTRAIEAGLQGVHDPVQIAAHLGEPGAFATIVITLLATGGAALLVYFLRHRADATERAASWRRARCRATFAWAAIAGTGTLVLSVLIGWVGERAGVEVVPTNLSLVEAAIKQNPVFLFLFATVLAPAYEELLFRRILFGRFLQAGRPWLGIMLSSAAFALMHELPGVSGNAGAAMLQLWLIYGVMGAVFAWVYWRTGTLWAAIGAHALNNLLACGLIVLGYA
jgi:hypothetical protein